MDNIRTQTNTEVGGLSPPWRMICLKFTMDFRYRNWNRASPHEGEQLPAPRGW